MEVMIVDGRRYLINTDLPPHVLDAVCDDILKHYSPDIPVEFDKVRKGDL